MPESSFFSLQMFSCKYVSVLRHTWAERVMKLQLLHKMKLNYFVEMLGISMDHMEPSWEQNYPSFMRSFLFLLASCAVVFCLVILNCATHRENGSECGAALFLTVSTTATVIKISYFVIPIISCVPKVL